MAASPAGAGALAGAAAGFACVAAGVGLAGAAVDAGLVCAMAAATERPITAETTSAMERFIRCP